MTPESTGFLYPFIDAEERDSGALLSALAQSARDKALQSDALCASTLAALGDQLAAVATEMAGRFRAGGHLFAFGNGGSSTDAASLVQLFSNPADGVALPARSLVADQAILTAIGNDVGVELMFSRQLIVYGHPSDLAVGLSTSGNSDNVLHAFKEAKARGLLTIGLAGYEGGAMSVSQDVDHCLVVRSDSVHRIQEAQAAVVYASVVTHPIGDRSPFVSDDPPIGQREQAVLERIETFRRRRPRFRDEIITMAHGAGGKASAALIDSVFLEAFGDESGGPLNDASVMELPSGERVAITTDSFVVKPHRFPGGSIGDLAVNGTVNDLLVSGAVPAWIAAAFVLEEGFPVDELRGIVADMAAAAQRAGVRVVTGDTKVVNRGAADGVYITTTGVGLVPTGRALGPECVQPDDVILVSGTLGDHGMAVMLARGDLALEADLRSDTASVGELVDALWTAAPSIRWMRDPTRGGVGTVCNELARDANVAVVLEESALPVEDNVTGACDLLGIDPLYVANEGKFLAVVAPDDAEAGLSALRSVAGGERAAIIGEIAADPEGIVVLRTTFGGTRIVDMLVGDPLPRIC